MFKSVVVCGLLEFVLSVVHCSGGEKPCSSEADCATPTPYCVVGLCKGCRKDDDCPKGTRCVKQPIAPYATQCLGDNEANPQDAMSQEPVVSDATEQTAFDATGQEPVTVSEESPQESVEPLAKEMAPDQPAENAAEVSQSDTGEEKEPPHTEIVSDAAEGAIEEKPEPVGKEEQPEHRCAQGQNPQPEICNGKDDDCDGVIDNGFANLGQSCESGKGECKATGKYVCKTDGSGTECNAKPGSPATETCNDKDDDCDGVIDNGVPNCAQHCKVKTDCPPTCVSRLSGRPVYPFLQVTRRLRRYLLVSTRILSKLSWWRKTLQSRDMQWQR